MPRAEARRDHQDRSETRQRILAVARDLFAQHGYAGTSVRMIARALNITDPAVHYHFPTKQSLYDALLEQPEYGPLPLDSRPLTREAIVDQILHLFGWWSARPEMGQMLLREQLASHEPSLEFMAGGDETWHEVVAVPLAELYGERVTSLSWSLRTMMSGIFWDAILSYGAQVRPVLEQPYFKDRVRAMIERGLPPAPAASP